MKVVRVFQKGGFSPEQLEDDVSKQVLLEKAAVASVLHKSLVDFELKYHHRFTILNNITINHTQYWYC